MKLQLMTCLRCRHSWQDYPGAFGRNYKDGCPRCGHLYWTALEIK